MSDQLLRRVDRPRSVDKPTVPIVRCDQGNRYKLPFICVSNRHCGYETHFSGRTVPCPGAENGCRLCEQGRRIAWEGYVAATDPVHRTRQFLVVLTAGVMPDVLAWLEANKTLRGLYMQLSRPSCKPTGRCEILINRPPGILPGDLPKPVDVDAALHRVWKGSLALAYGEQNVETVESMVSSTAPPVARPDRHLRNGNGVSIAGSQ